MRKTEPRPSASLIRCFSNITVLRDAPVLDAPSGQGRNALWFSERQYEVVCADIDRHALQACGTIYKYAQSDSKRGSLWPIQLDLSKQEWPFKCDVFSAIVNVHFVNHELFELFRYSLKPGGFLYAESFGSHGGNHLMLPKPGQWKELLRPWLQILMYEERPSKATDCPAVSVKVFGKKKT